MSSYVSGKLRQSHRRKSPSWHTASSTVLLHHGTKAPSLVSLGGQPLRWHICPEVKTPSRRSSYPWWIFRVKAFEKPPKCSTMVISFRSSSSKLKTWTKMLGKRSGLTHWHWCSPWTCYCPHTHRCWCSGSWKASSWMRKSLSKMKVWRSGHCQRLGPSKTTSNHLVWKCEQALWWILECHHHHCLIGRHHPLGHWEVAVQSPRHWTQPSHTWRCDASGWSSALSVRCFNLFDQCSCGCLTVSPVLGMMTLYRHHHHETNLTWRQEIAKDRMENTITLTRKQAVKMKSNSRRLQRNSGRFWWLTSTVGLWKRWRKTMFFILCRTDCVNCAIGQKECPWWTVEQFRHGMTYLSNMAIYTWILDTARISKQQVHITMVSATKLFVSYCCNHIFSHGQCFVSHLSIAIDGNATHLVSCWKWRSTRTSTTSITLWHCLALCLCQLLDASWARIVLLGWLLMMRLPGCPVGEYTTKECHQLEPDVLEGVETTNFHVLLSFKEDGDVDDWL